MKKVFTSLFLLSFLVVATGATWLYSQVDSSLPLLNGKENVFGLTNTVIVERDKQGIVTLKAQSRTDIAIATGFVHAQERFFQMDLLRRNSAGELASLFGTMALDYDKLIRRHRFRDRARSIINQLPAEQLSLLKAYTRGVNQGLALLKAAPFEYLLLQQEPAQWSEEDSILTIFSMYIDLQYPDGKRERTLGLMKTTLSDEVYAFLNPKGSLWDAAIDNSHFSPSPLPKEAWPSASSAQRAEQQATNNLSLANNLTLSTNPLLPQVKTTKYQSDSLPGSNNWSISGKISSTGSAIVANDMHLGIRVPNTWFRASFEYPDTVTAQEIKITGATLPGTPNIVIGSNGNIAWGFTNSYGDYSDIITLTTNEDATQYLTPTGYQDFTYHKQIIAIKGEKAEEITIKETVWGPVIGQNHQGQVLAYRWVAHDIEAVNLTATELELAKNIEQAFNIATRSGIPSQNMMVGDKDGNIGWTIMGPIPKKQGNVGDTPSSWSTGENAWLGYLSADEYPYVKNPENNRLWTANSRIVGGDMLAKLGNGGYALGARASQIRDNLLSLKSYDEQALLAIALDDKAIFLQRWQQFILSQVLTTENLAKQNDFQQIKQLLNSDKSLAASVDSVSYRLVRNFRINVRDRVFSQLNSTLKNIEDSYNFRSIRHQIETPLWQLINEQPTNFLMLTADNWQSLFIAALQETFDDMTHAKTSEQQSLHAATWGQENTTSIKHPLSKAVPFIGHWLDMPAKALSGDSYMPKVQGKAFGASERMVVSPGHEESGIFHMPTSQAGHPWSPYYRAGHHDWEQGKASPFLPGETKYKLTLLSY
jgi:penicillin amidase